jgi:hypothetical protein
MSGFGSCSQFLPLTCLLGSLGNRYRGLEITYAVGNHIQHTLTSITREPESCLGEMVQDWKNYIKRESKAMINGNIIQSDYTVCFTLQFWKLGTDQSDDAKLVGFPSEMWCPSYYDWTEHQARHSHWQMDMTRQQDNTRGSRTTDNQWIHWKEEKHGDEICIGDIHDL